MGGEGEIIKGLEQIHFLFDERFFPTRCYKSSRTVRTFTTNWYSQTILHPEGISYILRRIHGLGTIKVPKAGTAEVAQHLLTVLPITKQEKAK